MISLLKRLSALAILVLVPSALALADGDGPTRKMTSLESASFNALKAVVRDALPKAPANYSFDFSDGSGSGELLLPASLMPEQLARFSFTAVYTLKREFSAAGQQRSVFMERAKGTPEQQTRLAALDARDAELTRARDQTRDRGEKDRIRAELKTVGDQASKLRELIMADYQAWVAAGGANVAAQNAEKSLPAREFTIRVQVNQDVSLNDKATAYTFRGLSLAFEQSEGCQDYDTCCITVFLGPFAKEKRVSGSTRYNVRYVNLGVPTKARGLVLSVAGPKDKPQSVRDFLGKVDLAKLAALLP